MDEDNYEPPLVERRKEADRLARLLQPGRDVAVLGPNGFGKTTLVGRVCHRVRRRFPEGVLVVDDLSPADKLTAVPSGRARVIISSDPDAIPAGTDVVQVGQMTERESDSLLTSGVPGPMRTDRLKRLTGRWPLLMGLANAAIREAIFENVPPGDASKLIADLLTTGGPATLDVTSADQRDQAVAAMVNTSLKFLDDTGRDRFAELAVFPENSPMPVDQVRDLWSGFDSVDFEALLSRLADLWLISRSPGHIHLHSVLHHHLRKS